MMHYYVNVFKIVGHVKLQEKNQKVFLPFQYAYDVVLGGLLAGVYGVNQAEKVCIKVFTHRNSPRIPSIFWI